MLLGRQIKRVRDFVACNRVICSNSHNYTSVSETERQPEESIVIPTRINRSSTDILYALSSTVNRDPTAPHYKYHDDPYLIPNSAVSKRTFVMAQESGRKAAQWIKEQHRELFMHQDAQPSIKEFLPKMLFTEESEVNSITLTSLIEQGEVKDAVLVYNLMKEKGLEIGFDVKQSLLELLCFTNNEESLPEELIEERRFMQSNAVREKHKKTWKDGDLAEQLFSEIEPKTSATYAALIRGMSKYYQVERAYALFQEALEKQLELDTNTFNCIISVSNFLKETADLRWELCQELLQHMSQQKILPNLYTMNALLEAISSFGNYKLARSCALRVLSEFKKLDIKPSLGTYYYILIICCRDRAPVSHVIVDILREIEGQEFTIQHPKDTFFFATAMDVCRNHLFDKGLAKKVETLLQTGNNYDLIGDKEAIYYRHYFALLCQTEPIEEFMKIYDVLVPNIYVPEPGVMEELLKAVEINGAVDILPRLWSDMIIFDHHRDSLLSRTLKIMINNKEQILNSQELAHQFGNIAKNIYEKVLDAEGKQKSRKIAVTGEMFGDIVTVLLRAGDFDKAVEVFAVIDKSQHTISGTPSEICLLEFVESCISNKSPSQALLCLQYAVENNMESEKLVKLISAGFTLNEVHLSKIKSLVGDTFLSKTI